MTKIIANLRTAIESRLAYSRTIVEIERLIEREQADIVADRDSVIASTHRQIDGATR